MPADILRKIVERRRRRIEAEGYAQGTDGAAAGPGMFLPSNRSVPLVPFPQSVICEIKRRSPSRGELAADIDPVAVAGTYIEAGARALSVLTEQDHFGGSLSDLIAIKRRYPNVAVLRKDFLFDEHDLRVSQRAGADAVLLIAAILDAERLGALLSAAHAMGLAALVEVHNRAELEMIRPLRPRLVGINSRNLSTFHVDLLTPLELVAEIDWPAKVVFESGLFHPHEVRMAAEAGFEAVLIGEGAVTNPGGIGAFVAAMEEQRGALWQQRRGGARGRAAAPPVWSTLAVRRARGKGAPLVKICGITNEYDALTAVAEGADVLGLVYADSPRSAPDGLARKLSARPEIAGGADAPPVPLVAVVVEPAGPPPDLPSPVLPYSTPPSSGSPAGEPSWLDRARADLEAGFLSALQLHGDSTPDTVVCFGHPFYKALRPVDAQAAARAAAYPSVRVLIDAYSPHAAGGTGLSVSEEIIEAARTALADPVHRGLWLAGGLDAVNVARIVQRCRPELVDASSKLESRPGHKDAALVAAFIAAAKGVAATQRPFGGIQ